MDPQKLVDSLTHSGMTRREDVAKHTDMTSLKKLCKNGGPSVVTDVFWMLMTRLSKEQSQVRLTTLMVMSELFSRSHCFRSLLVSSQSTFDRFIKLLGLMPDGPPLPPPVNARRLLVKKSMEVLKEWQLTFGKGYPLLASAIEYLSRDGGVDFSDQTRVDPHVQTRMRQEEEARRRLLEEKMREVVNNFRGLQQDIHSTIEQVNQGVHLLEARHDDALNQDDDEDDQNGRTNNVNGSASCPPPSDDPKITLITSIRDNYKILVRDSLPKLKEILKKLSRGVEFTENVLKEAIDLKNVILTLMSKLSELNILTDNQEKEENDSTDDDDFEEVPEKEGLQLVIPHHERRLYGLEDEPKKSMAFKEGRSCRKPLKSGRLCPRMDAVKCPFHGIIVDRDVLGVPVKEQDRQKEEKEASDQIPEWQNPAFLRDLEGAIGVDLTVGRKRKKGVMSVAEAKKSCVTPKDRLMAKVFSKKSIEALDKEAHQLANHGQFDDNWSYAMRS